jgi:hypothetical protein
MDLNEMQKRLVALEDTTKILKDLIVGIIKEKEEEEETERKQIHRELNIEASDMYSFH